MKVPFALRSMFTAPCEHSIIAQKAALDNGHTIVIQLPDTKSLCRAAGYKVIQIASLSPLILPTQPILRRNALPSAFRPVLRLPRQRYVTVAILAGL